MLEMGEVAVDAVDVVNVALEAVVVEGDSTTGVRGMGRRVLVGRLVRRGCCWGLGCRDGGCERFCVCDCSCFWRECGVSLCVVSIEVKEAAESRFDRFWTMLETEGVCLVNPAFDWGCWYFVVFDAGGGVDRTGRGGGPEVPRYADGGGGAKFGLYGT